MTWQFWLIAGVAAAAAFGIPTAIGALTGHPDVGVQVGLGALALLGLWWLAKLGEGMSR